MLRVLGECVDLANGVELAQGGLLPLVLYAGQLLVDWFPLKYGHSTVSFTIWQVRDYTHHRNFDGTIQFRGLSAIHSKQSSASEFQSYSFLEIKKENCWSQYQHTLSLPDGVVSSSNIVFLTASLLPVQYQLEDITGPSSHTNCLIMQEICTAFFFIQNSLFLIIQSQTCNILLFEEHLTASPGREERIIRD